MIKVNVRTLECAREAVHPRLKGLSAESLRNLQSLSPDPLPPELVDIEYWPWSEDTPAYDTRSLTKGAETLTADADTKTVSVTSALVPRDSVQVFNELVVMVDIKAAKVGAAGFTSTALGAQPSGPVNIQRVAELAYIATDARKKKGGGAGNTKRNVKSSFGGFMSLSNNQINDFEEESADFLQLITDREAALYTLLQPLGTVAMVLAFDTAIDQGWPT